MTVFFILSLFLAQKLWKPEKSNRLGYHSIATQRINTEDDAVVVVVARFPRRVLKLIVLTNNSLISTLEFESSSAASTFILYNILARIVIDLPLIDLLLYCY